MKAKLKFDMDKVKEFGKEHGEKFGLALAVLILGSFIVKAVSRERLPDTLEPDKIVAQSHAADAKIKSVPTPPSGVDVVPIKLSQVGNEVGFGPKGVEIGDLIKQPIEDPVKRVDPTMLRVEELRAVPFRGGITVNAAAGGILGGPPGAGLPGPVAAPAAAPGLVPGRGPAAGRGVRGAAGRPPVVGAPAGGLNGAVANAAAAGPQPFPADFHQPGPPSSGFAEGHYGIVITGLIPDQAQREEYARRFKNARRGVMVEGAAAGGRGRDRAEIEADSPQYVWCWLERTDTTEGKTTLLDFGDTQEVVHAVQQPDETLKNDAKKQVKELGMSPKTRMALETEQHRWAVNASEVVDKSYLSDPWFSWELPPVLLRDWGAEAAHLPQIPLAAPVALAPGEAQPAGNGAQPGGNDFDKPDAAGAGAGARAGAGPVRRHDMTMTGGGQAGIKAQADEVPYKLFRFVDLNVEPGHAYQYRVRMLLRNPNFGLEAQVLLKPDTARVAYRPTPWSEVSASVVIPPNTRLLGGSIDRPKHKEDTAKIGIFTFDVAQAVELIKQFDTELGALVGTSVPEQTIKGFADPVTRQIRDVTGDFRSPAVLLDLRGDDEKLPGAGGLTDPGEMLLLDDIDHPESARLIVVNEAKDKSTIDHWKKLYEPPAAPAAAAPGGLGVPAGPAKPATPGGGLLPPRAGQTPRRPTGR
jgi:hypothetical protein